MSKKRETNKPFSIRLIVIGVIVFSSFITISTVFSSAQESQTRSAAVNWYDNFMFNDKSFTFEFIRILGYASEGGANLGECIQTAKRIKAGDAKSWFSEWKAEADYLYNLAQEMVKTGNVISAREIFFRACCYYRTAGFYLHDKANLTKSFQTWQRSRKCFLKAIDGLSNIRVVRIPYENTTLPGYFLKAEGVDAKAPLLIIHTGFDGTAEELYFEVGRAATRRGYHCLLFEGPGQGEVIRVQKLPFRYDWEKVVTPVIDFATKLPEIDKDRICLMGISMGGYLAPRAAAFDKRIKVCIANGGIFDFMKGPLRHIPPELLKIADTDPGAFNAHIEEAMKYNTTVRWYFDNGMWTFGVNTPAELIKKLRKYNLRDVVKNIQCYMLVVDSEDDIFLEGQAGKLYNELNCPKEYILFEAKQAAQAHCQMGNIAISNEIIFNRLDRTLTNQ